jgi:hypothetical protein
VRRQSRTGSLYFVFPLIKQINPIAWIFAYIFLIAPRTATEDRQLEPEPEPAVA